jgi:hypothetical protein
MESLVNLLLTSKDDAYLCLQFVQIVILMKFSLSLDYQEVTDGSKEY